jgi:hypothetical protein
MKSILLSLASFAVAEHYVSDKGHLHLKLNSDGTFKILQLTDLHIQDADRKNPEDQGED